MKTIYSEAKQQLSNCMLHNDTEETMSALGFDRDYNCSGQSRYRNNFINITVTIPTAASVGRTTSAYDTLEQPFRYDKRRGRWSSASDFYFACTSHAFGSIVFSELPVYAVIFGGVYFLPAYLLSILLYAMPIFMVQTFLGQFSTSGTISAFRVAPIFKGIGYSILLLNLCSLAYYSVIVAVPFIYAANSLHVVIPWMSCDNAWNTVNCSTQNSYNEDNIFLDPHATTEFFRAIVRSTHVGSSPLSLSWPIICGVVGVWLVTLGILLKRTSFIGKFLRCSCILMFCLFLAIFLELMLNMNISWRTVLEYFYPQLNFSIDAILKSARSAIFVATWLFGPGWGSVLTLSSYNSFHSDSERLTYWVSFTHILLVLAAVICGRIALDHYEDHVGFFHYHVEEEHCMQFLYLCFAYLFGSLSHYPNFWSFLFFSMIFLAELCALIVQMMCVLTALFDEYETLRSMRTRITVGLSIILMLFSIYFCTQQGFDHLDVLPTIALLTYIIISTVLLLMTTWIYGRERFQCDLQFMLGKTISNMKIFLMRFVTPIFLLICLTLFLLELSEPSPVLIFISQGVVFIISLTYMIHKLYQTTGSREDRLKQCLAPQDWHPVDADNRRFYEEVMDTSEMLVIDNANNA